MGDGKIMEAIVFGLSMVSMPSCPPCLEWLHIQLEGIITTTGDGAAAILTMARAAPTMDLVVAITELETLAQAGIQNLHLLRAGCVTGHPGPAGDQDDPAARGLVAEDLANKILTTT